MAFIAETILGAKINRLIRKRDEALSKRDYKRVWHLNMEIDRDVNRLVSFSYLARL